MAHLQTWPQFSCRATAYLLGHGRSDDIFSSFHFSKLNFKIQSSLHLIVKQYGLFSTGPQPHGERCTEDNSDTMCTEAVDVICFMPSWWILLNRCCSWGQAVNSPSKRHSYGRTYGISVGRAGPTLFHPVQDVTSKRHFSPTELLLARVICGCVIDSWICEMGTGHAGSSSS